MHGLTSEQVKKSFPACYSHLKETVYKVRKTNKDAKLRDQWWLFRRANDVWRGMVKGLPRFIATTETTEHSVFSMVPAGTIAEHGTVSFGTDDAYVLGLLSSRFHRAWVERIRGRRGKGNTPRYNKTRCFDPFPLPDASEKVKDRIRDLAEELDRHRRAQLAAHPKLTYTDMYNVLAKLRAGEDLTGADLKIHEQALGTILVEIHERLDAAVAKAYGWDEQLSDEEIVSNLIELNAARRREEETGTIRWLRPDFQRKTFEQLAHPMLAGVDDDDDQAAEDAPERRSWPPAMKDQVTAVRSVLGRGTAWSADQVAAAFTKVDAAEVENVLESLAALGLAVELHEGGASLWKGGDRLASVRPPPPSAGVRSAS